jgi:hypothetical protein
MRKGIATLVFMIVATRATFAQWNGPAPSGQPNTQDISDGMQALSGVAVLAQPPGTALPCKCCGAAVSAKYITTSYPQVRETEVLMAYMVYWQISVNPVTKSSHGDQTTEMVGDLSLVCEYTPAGDWSSIPPGAIPPLVLAPVTFPANPSPSQVIPSYESWVPAIGNYQADTTGTVNYTCVVPNGTEVSPETIQNFPAFTPPTGGHNFTYGRHDGDEWVTGGYLGYVPAYRGLVKIPVQYTVQVNYSRWALICGAGHDQSLPCDGTGGLGTAVPDQSTQTPAPNNLVGDYFGQPGYTDPGHHDGGGGPGAGGGGE